MISTGNATDTIAGGVNRAREAVATRSGAFNLDTKLGRSALEVGVGEDWVPADLCEGVAIAICVGSSNIWGPIAQGLGPITPDASILDTNARLVDIETVRVRFGIKKRG